MDCQDAGNGRQTLNILMQRSVIMFHCDKDGSTSTSDDFLQMKTAKGSGDEVASYAEVFVAFEKGLRWLEARKECNSMRLLTSKKFCDLSARNVW